MAMADDQREKELATMRSAGEEQLRSAAVREMRAVMVRLAKGEVAMRVEMWRSGMKAAAIEAADVLRAKLEADMKAGQQSAAVRQLALIMTRMMKGETFVLTKTHDLTPTPSKVTEAAAHIVHATLPPTTTTYKSNQPPPREVALLSAHRSSRTSTTLPCTPAGDKGCLRHM